MMHPARALLIQPEEILGSGKFNSLRNLAHIFFDSTIPSLQNCLAMKLAETFSG
jgi:hypothetical protein